MLGRYTDKTFNHFQLCSQQGWTLWQIDCEHCIPALGFVFLICKLVMVRV